MMVSRKTIMATVVVFAVSLCAIVAFWVFLLMPQNQAVEDSFALITSKEAELIAEQNGENGSDDELLKQLLSIHEELCSFVISPTQASDLSVDINRIAKNTGLYEFSSTNRMQGAYGSINECEHIVEGRMQVEFKGSFSQFAKFINDLERSRPVIFVDNFEIKRSEDNDDRHEVDMVLVFFVGQSALDEVMNKTADLCDINNAGSVKISRR